MKWPRRLGSGPRRLDQHGARMCPAMLADPAVLGEAQAGLPDSGIEPDIAHKLLGAAEALDIADRGNYNREIDTGDGQQALHGRIVDRGLSDLPVEHAQV